MVLWSSSKSKTDDDVRVQDQLKSIAICMQFREIEEAFSVMFKKREVEECIPVFEIVVIA
jgi:hypothetical protein